MTCLEVHEVLPDLLDVPVGASLPIDFESHIKGCTDCSGLVSDLRSIVNEAPQLMAADEPSPLLWLRIAAQLRSEGLIREQEAAKGRSLYGPSSSYAPNLSSGPSLVRTSPRPRRPLPWLIPVAAVLLVAGTYVVKHQAAPVASTQKAPGDTAPGPASANVNTPATTATEPTGASSNLSASKTSSVKKNTSTPDASQVAQNSPVSRQTIESAPSDTRSDDEQFLSVVSTRAPAMRTTYEKQLQAANADISETQAYVDQNPNDADARQHLMDAYQQKALLYQIALDRIQ